MRLEAILAGTGCFTELYSRVEADFSDRLPGYHKSRREGLSVLASVILNTRSVNLMENAAALPRKIGSVDHRYQYISRLLGNSHIDPGEVMQAYAGEIFRRHCEARETTVLALDQSKLNEGLDVVGAPAGSCPSGRLARPSGQRANWLAHATWAFGDRVALAS